MLRGVLIVGVVLVASWAVGVRGSRLELFDVDVPPAQVTCNGQEGKVFHCTLIAPNGVALMKTPGTTSEESAWDFFSKWKALGTGEDQFRLSKTQEGTWEFALQDGDKVVGHSDAFPSEEEAKEAVQAAVYLIPTAEKKEEEEEEEVQISADMSKEQMRALLGGPPHDPREDKELYLEQDDAQEEADSHAEYAEARASLPDTFSVFEHWKDCGAVVRDQAGCGSCWAFALTSMLDHRMCISSKGQAKIHSSPEHLICKTENYCEYGKARDGAEVMMLKGGGVTSLECYPYVHGKRGKDSSWKLLHGCSRICEQKYFIDSFDSVERFLIKSKYGAERAMRKIQAELMRGGPVICHFDVYKDFFKFNPTTTIYEHEGGSEDEEETAGAHFVKVVGWGVSDDNKPYWVAANSWGPKWGFDYTTKKSGGLFSWFKPKKGGGYFKFYRGRNDCGFEQRCVTLRPIVPTLPLEDMTPVHDPPPIDHVAITAAGLDMELEIKHSPDDGFVSAYEVEVRPSGGDQLLSDYAMLFDPLVHSGFISFSALEHDVYEIRIRARNAGKHTPWTEWESVRMHTGERKKPGRVHSVVAILADDMIEIVFERPTTGGDVTDYSVELRHDGTPVPLKGDTADAILETNRDTNSAAILFYDIASFSSGKLEVRVFAHNAQVSGEPSDWVVVES